MGDFVEVESKNPDHKKHKSRCFLMFREPKEVDLFFSEYCKNKMLLNYRPMGVKVGRIKTLSPVSKKIHKVSCKI